MEEMKGKMLKQKTILHLCADIGSDSIPYRKAGYEVITVGQDIGVENYDPPENVYGIIANPVCTEFSFAKWKHNKGAGDHEDGMKMVNDCLNIIHKANPNFWILENPATGRLKDFIGKPDFTYEPWHFGDPWTKRTAIWGDFNTPQRLFNSWEDVEKNGKLYVRPNRPKASMAFLHKSAIKNIPSFAGIEVENDMAFRSLCPQGFANAFFKSNK